jgi:signal transduction histidine kinase
VLEGRPEDGTVIDVSLTVSPIRDAAGRIIGASKIGRDITERKRIEAERIDADRRKDEFLAMLAHELSNPLASISNAVHLFGQLETEEELEWAKDVVQRQVKHLARLIDDLLDVSRITRGKIALK